MSIIVGKSYSNLNIEPGSEQVVFPENFDQAIKPGSIPSSVTRIMFKDKFNQDLEPGVITDVVSHLVLGKGYKRPLLPGVIPETTAIFIHDDNREFVPADRPFYLYRKRNDGHIVFSEPKYSVWAYTPSARSMIPGPEQMPMQVIDGEGELWASCLITPKLLVCTPAEPVSTDQKLDEVITKLDAFSKDMIEALAKITHRLNMLEVKASK